jgi:hypothetical protein
MIALPSTHASAPLHKPPTNAPRTDSCVRACGACVWCMQVVRACSRPNLQTHDTARHGTTRHDTKRRGTHARTHTHTTNTHAHMQHARKQTRMHAHTPTCTHFHTHARTHKFIAGVHGLGSCNSAAARTRALQCNRSSSNLISYMYRNLLKGGARHAASRHR